MKTITLVALLFVGLTRVNAASQLVLTNHTANPVKFEVVDTDSWSYYVQAYSTLQTERPQTPSTRTVRSYTVPGGVQIGADVTIPPNGSWLVADSGGTWVALELEADHIPMTYLWGMTLAGFSVVGCFMALMGGLRVTRSGERSVL